MMNCILSGGKIVLFAVLLCAVLSVSCMDDSRGGDSREQTDVKPSVRIGWGEADITPDEPVFLAGQFHARISEGVRDPVTATVMAVESTGEHASHVVVVSCDLVSINECMRESVREKVSARLPEIAPESLILSATHTHSAPYARSILRYSDSVEPIEHPYGVELDAMSPVEYVEFASGRIADAVVEAWEGRALSGIAYGLGHAVVARNRIIAYADGTSRMRGPTNVPEFSHIEGYEDHSVNILASYGVAGELTGLIVNISAPSQLSEREWRISADFWHETRKELRERFGEHIYVLAQHGPAGDQCARPMVDSRPEQRMLALSGRDSREEVAVRIADAVTKVLPVIERAVDYNPALIHHFEVLELPRRELSWEDVETALLESEPHRKRYEEMIEDLERNPEIKREPRWYTGISETYRRMERGERVQSRFKLQQKNPYLPVEVHAVRLGDVGFATNPFELYLDYGMRIRGRSPAVQTFLVQLAGPGSYVPTARSIDGGAYGAVPASTEIGAEGGQALVEWSVGILEELWAPADRVVPYVGAAFEADGDISKWENYPYIELGGDHPGFARVYTGRDEENFYLAAAVRDEAHFNTREGGGIWDGDSLQFAFVPRDGSEAFNLGLALASGRVQAHKFAGPDTGLLESSDYTVIRKEEKGMTYYEIKIPFEYMKLEGVDGERFRFNAVVFNDDDGYGFDYWVEISMGLAGGWNPRFFGHLVLGD